MVSENLRPLEYCSLFQKQVIYDLQRLLIQVAIYISIGLYSSQSKLNPIQYFWVVLQQYVATKEMQVSPKLVHVLFYRNTAT